mmetsp:Transcript_25333/g.57719  ORF Transcript_25333/g.57719 Transcript_25333/m.57719 type:complete len:212 (+) Transcript_25333:227-862(+)
MPLSSWYTLTTSPEIQWCVRKRHVRPEESSMIASKKATAREGMSAVLVYTIRLVESTHQVMPMVVVALGPNVLLVTETPGSAELSATRMQPPSFRHVSNHGGSTAVGWEQSAGTEGATSDDEAPDTPRELPRGACGPIRGSFVLSRPRFRPQLAKRRLLLQSQGASAQPERSTFGSGLPAEPHVYLPFSLTATISMFMYGYLPGLGFLVQG